MNCQHPFLNFLGTDRLNHLMRRAARDIEAMCDESSAVTNVYTKQ